MSVVDKINYWMRVKGMRPAEVAKAADKDVSALYKLLDNPNRSPTEKTLQWIADGLGISMTDLVGAKPQLSNENEGTASQFSEDDEPYTHSHAIDGHILIPEIDGFAGMGSAEGALYTENDNGVLAESHKANWQFPKPWVQALGIGENGLYLIEAIGDSNSPNINSGDKVLVNTKDRVPSPPGFFALWDGLGVVIKRIEVIPNTDPLKVVIRSANSAYEKYERTLEEVTIIGRIRAGIMRM